MSGSKNNHESGQQKSSKGSFKDWSASLSAFLALILALIAVINAFIKQFTVAIVAVFIAYVFATLWFTAVWAKDRKTWRRASFVVLYVVTALFFFGLGAGVETSPTSNWPPDLMTYYDFETEADFEGWPEQAERSTDYAFSGKHALKSMQQVQADQETWISLRWQHEFTADVVVGQVYWPENKEVGIVWAQVCIPLGGWACKFFSVNRGGWNTFALKLSEMAVGDVTLDKRVLPGLHFQGKLRGATGTDVITMPMYVDAIQIFED